MTGEWLLNINNNTNPLINKSKGQFVKTFPRNQKTV